MKARLKEQFLVDGKGHKQAVVIDLEDYQKLMEDVADLRVVAERKDNPKIPFSHFVIRLKRHGIL